MDFISIAAMRRAARGRALRCCEKIVVAAPGIAMGVKPIATEVAGGIALFSEYWFSYILPV